MAEQSEVTLHKTVIKGSEWKKQTQARNKLERQKKGEFFSKLNTAQKMIQGGKIAKGLTVLDYLASQNPTPIQKSRIIAVTGDGEFKQGKFTEAAVLYHKAFEQVPGEDPLAWLRPALAEVWALLKQVEIEAAIQRAHEIWDKGLKLHQESELQLKITNQQLQQQGHLAIKKRPMRASVLAARLGNLFLQEGELEPAEKFFLLAVNINPQGAARAREGLAKIALAKNQPVEAEKRAREALLLGKFQSKTVSVWPILIAARQKQGIKGIDSDYLSALLQIKEDKKKKEKTVKARAILQIIKTLRSYNDSSWETVAAQWMQQGAVDNPVMAVEIYKLWLSQQKLENNNPQERVRLAQELLKLADALSAIEYISTTKELVRSQFILQQIPDIDHIIENAVKHYGKSIHGRIIHSIASSSILAGRHDVARSLFQRNITQLPVKSIFWGRSVWALARMEDTLKNYAAAAGWYERFSFEKAIPERFRAQAQLKWIEALINSGDYAQIQVAEQRIRETLLQSNDFIALLDFAKQLFIGPKELKSLSDEFLSRGRKLAYEYLDSCSDPTQQVKVLHHVTRRQCELGDYLPIIHYWNKLGQTGQNRLWSHQQDFWGFVRQVFLAHWWEPGYRQAARQIAQSYLNDPATLETGLIMLGYLYGYQEIRYGDQKTGLSLYHRLENSAGHEDIVFILYWLALEAWLQNRKTDARNYAERIQYTMRRNPADTNPQWEKDMAISIQCIFGELEPEKIVAQSSYDFSTVKEFLGYIHRDLELLKKGE